MSITWSWARRAAVPLLALLLLPLLVWPARAEPTTGVAAVDDVAAHDGLPGFAAVVTRGDDVRWVGGRGHDHADAPMTATTPLRLAPRRGR